MRLSLFIVGGGGGVVVLLFLGDIVRLDEVFIAVRFDDVELLFVLLSLLVIVIDISRLLLLARVSSGSTVPPLSIHSRRERLRHSIICHRAKGERERERDIEHRPLRLSQVGTLGLALNSDSARTDDRIEASSVEREREEDPHVTCSRM